MRTHYWSVLLLLTACAAEKVPASVRHVSTESAYRAEAGKADRAARGGVASDERLAAGDAPEAAPAAAPAERPRPGAAAGRFGAAKDTSTAPVSAPAGAKRPSSRERVEEKRPEAPMIATPAPEPAPPPAAPDESTPRRRPDVRRTEGGTGSVSGEGVSTLGAALAPKKGAETTARTVELPPKVAPTPRPRPRPASAGLKAGASDDNLSFGAFLDFLEDNRGQTLKPVDVSSRVIVSVEDQKGRPLHDARVTLRGGPFVQSRRTYADGRALLFPPVNNHVALSGQGFFAEVRYGGAKARVALDPKHRRRVTVTLDVARPAVKRVPLDVAFVLDTTGSMGDELARLKQTLDVIHFQIGHMSPRPDVRFGMVLYRDVGDDYRARKIPFTRDLEKFRRALAKVSAGGGGDYPEDVNEGLRVAMQELEWRETGVRVAFLIGDAPPQFGHHSPYTYVTAMQDAARRGIKIATIGASGLSRQGEVAWRQIAQYTMAPFVFLTYGEKGDSEGSASTVSHHVGSNWVAENLEAIVIRLVKSELAHLSPRGAPVREDYFSAAASASMPADDVLEDLFSQSVRQLLDYSVERIEPRTPTVVLPLTGAAPERGRAKLARRLQVGLARTPAFQLVEREAEPELLRTLARQLGETYDEAKAVEVGRLVPARLAVLGHIASPAKGRYEMLVKLVRVETGEVLSLSLLKIDDTLLM